MPNLRKEAQSSLLNLTKSSEAMALYNKSQNPRQTSCKLAKGEVIVYTNVVQWKVFLSGTLDILVHNNKARVQRKNTASSLRWTKPNTLRLVATAQNF